ncbi:hypothetical protein ACLX1H_002810 [Fusarium chlamydosporum]
MSSKAASILKTTVYAIWSIQFTYLTAIFCIWHELSIPNPFYAILTTVLSLPLPLSLTLFLIYTTASRFSRFDPYTRKFNKFFYETRDWAMVLPILSILWFICVLWWGLLVFMDIVLDNGPVSKAIALLCTIFNFVGSGLFYGGVLVYIGLPFWVLVTGFDACRRVWNLKSAGEGEATRLTTEHDDEDEWNDFQDNRGI